MFCVAKLQPGCHALLRYGVYVSIDRNKTVVGLGSFSERLAWPSLQNEAMPMQASPKTLSPVPDKLNQRTKSGQCG